MIRPSFYSLLRAIRNTWNKYLGYTTTARYADGTQFVHYSYGWEDALDWTRQYPADCTVVISQAGSGQVTVRIA